MPAYPLTSTFSLDLDRAAIAGKAAIVARMADDMRLFAATRGNATEDDMETIGWTRQQIETFGKDAARKARTLAAGR